MRHHYSGQSMLWSALLAMVNPSAIATAQTDEQTDGDDISLEIDLTGSEEAKGVICYGRPIHWHPKLEARFRSVIEGAADATRPEHADVLLRFIDDETSAKSCLLRLEGDLERGRKGEPRNLTLRVVEAGEDRAQATAGPLVPYRSTPEQLVPAWKKLWPVIAPPPPKQPPPEPESDETFVDDDLIDAREAMAARDETKDRGPFVTAMVDVGGTHRTIDVSPAVGRAQDLGMLVSVGGRLDLHFGEMLGLRSHRIDGRFAYWRQLAQSQVDGVTVGTEADRFRGRILYGRRWFGAAGPRIGAAAGLEYRRFVFGDDAETLSSELTAVRPGLELEQPLFGRDRSVRVGALAGGFARIPVGSDDFDMGVDARVGLNLRHRVGFVARLVGEYTHQSAAVDAASFSEDYVDVVFGVGWSL